MKTAVFSLFVTISFLLVSCGEKTIILTGYIPIGQKPVITWTPDKMSPASDSYDYELLITVISDDGKAVSARFSETAFPGGILVRFIDTYPPAKGKKVYVEMAKWEGVYWIRQASFTPYGEKK
ncbi:MAG: hypothetical protein WC908_02055 [Candidatus Paceibacterota bacterium]